MVNPISLPSASKVARVSLLFCCVFAGLPQLQQLAPTPVVCPECWSLILSLVVGASHSNSNCLILLLYSLSRRPTAAAHLVPDSSHCGSCSMWSYFCRCPFLNRVIQRKSTPLDLITGWTPTAVWPQVAAARPVTGIVPRSVPTLVAWPDALPLVWFSSWVHLLSLGAD